jgi:dihydrofolate reductase
MSKVRCQITVSADGFVAGPNQTPEEPLGKGGEALHEWMLNTASWRESHGKEGGERTPDSDIVDEVRAGVGAYIMGRKMFGGGDGEWDESWTGWWGTNPPYHVPVYVLTHHEREPLPMEGGTTFHFVTGGIESALEQAREAAGDKDVEIAGGASTVNQFLAAGLLEELYLHIAPLTLGGGERLFEDVGNVVFEPIKVAGSPAATHIKYRVLC